MPVDPDELRAHLMAKRWGGGLIDQTVELAERIASGHTPHHRPFPL
jgi:hypothetical protein